MGEQQNSVATDPLSWEWVQAELRAKGEAIAVSLRTGVDAAASVPNLDWNVGRLGAHIIAVVQTYRRAQDAVIELPDVTDATSIPKFSNATADAVGTTDPNELADLVVPEIESLIERLGPDGDAPAKWYQHDMTVREAGGVVLSELLAHHIDLVGATGEPKSVAKVSNEQARAAFRGLFAASAHLVNSEVARKCEGVLHIHLPGPDGGDHWTTTIADGGVLTTPGRPDDADFHTRAEASTLLLVSVGRSSRAIAMLTGQIIGFGRKPLLAWRAQNLFYVV